MLSFNQSLKWQPLDHELEKVPQYVSDEQVWIVVQLPLGEKSANCCSLT